MLHDWLPERLKSTFLEIFSNGDGASILKGAGGGKKQALIHTFVIIFTLLYSLTIEQFLMQPYPGCTRSSILMHPLLISNAFSSGVGAICDAPNSGRGAIFDASKIRSGAIFDAPKIRRGAISDAIFLRIHFFIAYSRALQSHQIS